MSVLQWQLDKIRELNSFVEKQELLVEMKKQGSILNKKSIVGDKYEHEYHIEFRKLLQSQAKLNDLLNRYQKYKYGRLKPTE